MVVWVITGDKEETAINIGVACQLLWAEDRMDRCIINTKVGVPLFFFALWRNRRSVPLVAAGVFV